MRRGDEYRIGERQEQSFERAVDYYHRAAHRNYAPAQYMMGIMYESGHGVPQSYKEAAKWYEKAFNQGYRRATSAMAKKVLLYLAIQKALQIELPARESATVKTMHDVSRMVWNALYDNPEFAGKMQE